MASDFIRNSYPIEPTDPAKEEDWWACFEARHQLSRHDRVLGQRLLASVEHLSHDPPSVVAWEKASDLIGPYIENECIAAAPAAKVLAQTMPPGMRYPAWSLTVLRLLKKMKHRE